MKAQRHADIRPFEASAPHTAGQGSGALKGRCAGNAETARPTMASGGMLQANTCKLLRCWGVAKTTGGARCIGSSFPVKPPRNHPFDNIGSSILITFPSWSSSQLADRRSAELQIQGLLQQPPHFFRLDSVGPVGEHAISFQGFMLTARHSSSLQAPSVTAHPRHAIAI
jgi:hypothetical protein